MWAALAPYLAGQPRVRLSKDAGKSYPQRFERDLTSGLPSFPAAVRIHGKDGTCAALFLDFDSSIAGMDWVEADVRKVQTWLHRLGGRWIEDYSPNGGRHVYIPLAQRVTFSEARDVVEALGNRLRTLDKTPHQNINHGCMRIPGSVHKRGGHQQLAMSLNMAYDVVRRPNSALVWAAITADLASEISAVRALRRESAYETPIVSERSRTAPVTGRTMSRTMQQIAVTGMYDANRYGSHSDARQAVLVGAAAAGMELTDVDRRMKQGTWPGLASFYARYPARHRAKALQRDWAKAIAHVEKGTTESHGENHVHKSPTSKPITQAGGLHGWNSFDPATEHRFIRSWRNALILGEDRYVSSRAGLARRMVLRALGEAAHKSHSRFIEFGERAIAVATGLDNTTAGSHLRALREEADPFITLIESGRGTHGDLYMLTIPASIRERAEDKSWAAGAIHALRPVFRELGLPAAFVYEAIERSPDALTTTEIVRTTGLSRTAVSEALETLAAWNLASRSPTYTWAIVANTNLQVLAEHFGVLDVVATQIARYKAERVRWRDWLAKNMVEALLPSPTDDYPWHEFEGPPDEWTLADMAFSAAS